MFWAKWKWSQKPFIPSGVPTVSGCVLYWEQLGRMGLPGCAPCLLFWLQRCALSPLLPR